MADVVRLRCISNASLAQAVDEVVDYAIFVLDPQGYVTTWNKGARRVKGYEENEVLGRHFSVFYPPEDVQAGKCQVGLKVAERVGRFEDEGWRLRKDGSRFWASVVITAVKDETGQLQGFTKVTRDLTAKRISEESLRQSEERFRLLVGSVRDYAIFMLDPQGHVQTWNQGAESIKGYSAEEIVGQHISRFYTQADRDEGKPFRLLREAEIQGRVEDEGWRVRKDGELFWADVVITAVRDATGKLVGFAKITRDLTERKRAEENDRQLLQEKAAREAAESAKSRLKFLASAGATLAQSLDYETNLRTLASLVVPRLADWSSVSAIDRNGDFRRLAVVVRDPQKVELARQYESKFPPGEHRGGPYFQVLRSGKSVLLPVVNESLVASAAQTEEHAQILKGLGTSCCMMVPLVWRQQVIGLLNLVRSEPGNEYGPVDLAMAEELAARAALAVENAKLFEAQSKARADAQSQRDRLYSVFRQAPVVINFFRGPDLVFELAHPTLVKRLGRRLEGKPLLEAMPEQRDLPFAKLVLKVLQTGEPESGKEALARLDLTHSGKLEDTYWDYTYLPIRNASGEIDGVMTCDVEVTDQVLARTRLEDMAQDLRAAEAQLRGFIENLPQLAWTARPDGYIDYYNRRWYEYTGTTPEEMEGWGWQKVHAPDVLPKVIDSWEHSLKTGEPFEMEFPLRDTEGVFRWFLTRVNPLKDSDGRIIRWFGTNTNVDEQRRQAVLLREAVQTRDAFLSVASHELKTPLTPMALRLQSLAKATEAQADSAYVKQVRTYVATADKQIGKLSQLINDLLDVSRIAAGRLKMDLEPVDVAALLREVVVRFEPEANRAGTSIMLSAPRHLTVTTAKARLDQVFTNLLDNAIKYGGGKPVKVSMTQSDREVTVVVTDEGIGISPENLSRIFERFERAVSDRNYGGLGLGLYITRSIVEALGGRVEVESRLGVGTTFKVALTVGALEEKSEIASEGPKAPLGF